MKVFFIRHRRITKDVGMIDYKLNMIYFYKPDVLMLSLQLTKARNISLLEREVSSV